MGGVKGSHASACLILRNSLIGTGRWLLSKSETGDGLSSGITLLFLFFRIIWNLQNKLESSSMQMHLTFSLQLQGGFQMTHSRKHSAWTNTMGKKAPLARQLLQCGLRKGRAFHPAISFLGEQQEKQQKFPLCTPASLLFPFPARLSCAVRRGALCSLRIAVVLFTSAHWQCTEIPLSYRGASSTDRAAYSQVVHQPPPLHEVTLTTKLLHKITSLIAIPICVRLSRPVQRQKTQCGSLSNDF